MPSTEECQKTVDISKAIEWMENEAAVAWSMYLSTGYGAFASRNTRYKAVADLLKKLKPLTE